MVQSFSLTEKRFGRPIPTPVVPGLENNKSDSARAVVALPPDVGLLAICYVYAIRWRRVEEFVCGGGHGAEEVQKDENECNAPLCIGLRAVSGM
jgi:hypothetical protein